MTKYLPWLLLSLPTVLVLLLWSYLPTQLPVHYSINGPDRLGSKDDFAGLVLSMTLTFGLLFYILIQVFSTLHRIKTNILTKAPLFSSIGASAMGILMVALALFNV